jgi:hypothetical protein
LSTYTDIASYYLALAAPLADVAGETPYPDGSDAGVVANALQHTVHRTVWATDRLKAEET